jgi:hypothetical protein
VPIHVHREKGTAPMVTVVRIDLGSRAQITRFVDFPYRLYADTPQWVPPMRMDVRMMLNRKKHPFYERSDAAFFLATRDGRDVGRIAVLENVPFNEYHHAKKADFYCFETEDDPDIVAELFEQAFSWARSRGLTRMVGPKGFSVFDGYGILVDGFEHRPVMTMTNYNLPYYGRLLEGLGFSKEVDFVSFYATPTSYTMPERMRRVADRVRERGVFRVESFPTKKALAMAAPAIGRTYNQAFVDNWEYYPLSDREIKFLLDQVVLIAKPGMIKVIMKGDQMVGFLFAFADLSAALQRARGRLTPWALIDLMTEAGRTNWIALNGAGVLPRYQGRGGNALLYSEIERTLKTSRYHHADLPQVAETAVQMRRDLEELGATPYKTHRVFQRAI